MPQWEGYPDMQPELVIKLKGMMQGMMGKWHDDKIGDLMGKLGDPRFNDEQQTEDRTVKVMWLIDMIVNEFSQDEVNVLLDRLTGTA